MVLCIDASSILAGGGVTHLSEVLKHADPKNFGFEKVILFGGKNLDFFDDREWLEKKKIAVLDKHAIKRGIWQSFSLSKEVKRLGADVLFIPSGTFLGNFRPFVTICQNMLVFENEESRRYSLMSYVRLRLFILRLVQGRTFKSADGIIFISEYAREYVTQKLKRSLPNRLIFHGISDRFRKIKSNNGKLNDRLRLLYVSIIDVYKHQEKVSQAVLELNDSGHNIELVLVGPAYDPSLRKLQPYLNHSNIKFLGKVPFEVIEQQYHAADAFIFASTCENMPNIVIEAMAAGLPILSADKQPMPEFLKDAAIYFDALSIESIKSAILELIQNEQKRKELSQKAYDYSLKYDWKSTADQTFEYLNSVASDQEITRIY